MAAGRYVVRRSKKDRKWAGLILGPAIVFFALSALWKNETRFDFYNAARKTKPVIALGEAAENELFSHTGEMDSSLTIDGDYVQSFVGYLLVIRKAEIYAWEEDEDDDGSSTWHLSWQSSVESNSRNSGIRQQLSSKRLKPSEYLVGGLQVTASLIEFVDSTVDLATSKLTSKNPKFTSQGSYLYLRKNRPNNLGDERVHYEGIPVPNIATYFGKFASGKGVPDTSHQRTGWINQIIQDTGVLHHLVAGDRETALASMRAYLRMIKWLVRGIGVVSVVGGFWILFSCIFGFIFHWPIIGRIAEAGTFVLALAIGLPLAAVTIVVGFLFGNPIFLALILVALVVAIYVFRSRGKRSQEIVQRQLFKELGPKTKEFDLKEIEFFHLAKLALVDGKISGQEQEFLYYWGKKHRWDKARCDRLIGQSRSFFADDTSVSSEEQLKNLVRLALADGSLSHYELQTIRSAAKKLGYDDKTVNQWMDQIRKMPAKVFAKSS